MGPCDAIRVSLVAWGQNDAAEMLALWRSADGVRTINHLLRQRGVKPKEPKRPSIHLADESIFSAAHVAWLWLTTGGEIHMVGAPPLPWTIRTGCNTCCSRRSRSVVSGLGYREPVDPWWSGWFPFCLGCPTQTHAERTAGGDSRA